MASHSGRRQLFQRVAGDPFAGLFASDVPFQSVRITSDSAVSSTSRASAARRRSAWAISSRAIGGDQQVRDRVGKLDVVDVKFARPPIENADRAEDSVVESAAAKSAALAMPFCRRNRSLKRVSPARFEQATGRPSPMANAASECRASAG